MASELISESIFIDAPVARGTTKYSKEELHIKRFYTNPHGTPILMIHGSVENGKIFYSSSGKGIAPYLAKKGYDVFIPDLRGRGLSKPAISKNSTFGWAETIEIDLPLYIEKIKELKGDVPIHWVAHSWGGVIILAYLALHPTSIKTASMVFFATKRKIKFNSFKKIWTIRILWDKLARLAIQQKGFFDAKRFKAGSDNETKRIFKESTQWVKTKKWRHWYNGFDFAAALKKQDLPPTLNLIGTEDQVLCHPQDIELLIKETGAKNHKYQVIGKLSGFKNDYGHNDILSHPDAEKEVYPIALTFLQTHIKY
jgi:pimeloyl-ACP methyl ester carboxylesterase